MIRSILYQLTLKYINLPIKKSYEGFINGYLNI